MVEKFYEDDDGVGDGGRNEMFDHNFFVIKNNKIPSFFLIV